MRALFAWSPKAMLRRCLQVLVCLCLCALGGMPALAAETPTFTVVATSAFLHDAPSVQSPRTYSLFQGQVFAIVGRNADGSWLQLDFAGATRGTWVWTPVGKVTGRLGGVPVAAGNPTPAPTAAAPTPPAGPAGSASVGHVTFTVVAKAIFVRSRPDLSGTRLLSVFKGQTFNVLARTADSLWLKIDVAAEAWVYADNGTVHGNLKAVTEAGAAPTPAATPLPGGTSATPEPANPAALAPLPVISARARQIYQFGLTLGNNPRAFAKVGDCNSVLPYFLAPFDNSADFRLGQTYDYLQETIRNFSGSFSRVSQAAQIGFSTTSVLSSQWANPKVCRKGETPLICEYRLGRPSLAFISLGTNGEWLTDEAYETGLRNILEYSIQHGVLPILATKADDAEGAGRYTTIVQKLAAEYAVPLWDFRKATEALPDRGLMPDGVHLTWGPATFDDPAQITTGWQVRNLSALQVLDAVWRAVR